MSQPLESSAWRKVPMLFVGLFLIAACGPKEPPPPLLSPVQDNRGKYGYSQEVIGPKRIEISYYAPTRRVPPGGVYREPFTQPSINLAADLALWRAAQIARERGDPRFTVVRRRSDVVVDRYRGGFHRDPFFGAPFPRYYPYQRGFGFGYPYGYPFPYYSYQSFTYEPPRAYGRAIVHMRVFFGTLPGRRSQSTDAVIARMTARYGPANAPAPRPRLPQL